MKKVVIIGAGPAGLTAAFELKKRVPQDYDVTILEESGEIGGISRTVKYKNNRMDIGGHRFFSKDPMVMKWWKDLMPLQGAPSYDDKKLGREKVLSKGGPDPEREDRVMLVRQRVSRIYYQKKFFDYPVTMKPQTFINMGFTQTVKAGTSYLNSCIHKLPETSLENFYVNRFGRVLYGMFFEGYTEKLWGRHPREISADWGAQRVKGLSVTAVVKDMFEKMLPNRKDRKVETSLIEEFLYPKYGPGQLWETAAAEKQEPPYERAMAALQALRDSKLWQQGQEKSYYTRLVDILREYIDSRFGIRAMEMTSAQIIEALRQNGTLREVNRYLSEILSMADFVKFAKMRPMPDDNERVMRQAVDFLELTKPQPEPEPAAGDAQASDEKENK